MGQPPALPVNAHRIGPAKRVPRAWTAAGARCDKKTGANWKEKKTFEGRTQATWRVFSVPLLTNKERAGCSRTADKDVGALP